MKLVRRLETIYENGESYVVTITMNSSPHPSIGGSLMCESELGTKFTGEKLYHSTMIQLATFCQSYFFPTSEERDNNWKYNIPLEVKEMLTEIGLHPHTE